MLAADRGLARDQLAQSRFTDPALLRHNSDDFLGLAIRLFPGAASPGTSRDARSPDSNGRGGLQAVARPHLLQQRADRRLAPRSPR